MPAFNPLTTSAAQLRDLLHSGQISSFEIVNTYVTQIEQHNHAGLKLNALITVAPLDLLQRTARALDQERKEGRVRSELHGIPIVLKVGRAWAILQGFRVAGLTYAWAGQHCHGHKAGDADHEWVPCVPGRDGDEKRGGG
jgi:hypothetical protein